MPYAEIIVLANSKKEGGRCVAGLETDGGSWIRPVAPGADDALYPRHYTLNCDGKPEPQLLDVVRINLYRPNPLPHQPENWIIGQKPWTLIKRPAEPGFMRILVPHLTKGPGLLGDQADRIDHQDLLRRPAEASLTLVATGQVRRRAVPRPPRRPQTRATFSLGNVQYDLAVTDPKWQHELGKPEQIFERLWLTISLGDEFMGFCYKLVAGVIAALPELDGEEKGKAPAPRDPQRKWWAWLFE